jgi:hypothetical protein
MRGLFSVYEQTNDLAQILTKRSLTAAAFFEIYMLQFCDPFVSLGSNLEVDSVTCAFRFRTKNENSD